MHYLVNCCIIRLPGQRRRQRKTKENCEHAWENCCRSTEKV